MSLAKKKMGNCFVWSSHLNLKLEQHYKRELNVRMSKKGDNGSLTEFHFAPKNLPNIYAFI